MKALALIESPEHVCFRYRLSGMAWAMAEQGLLLTAQSLAKGVYRRLGQFMGANRADVVILQRKLLPRWQLHVLRQSVRCLVYDLDDALYQRDSFSPKGSRSRVRLSRFRATIAASDVVITGNDHLRQYAAAYTDPQRIHVVPTCLEPKWYQLAEHRRTDAATRMVWIGQQSMLPSLASAQPHLEAVAKRLPGIELRLISDAAPPLSHVSLVHCPWSSATEADDLAEADIGISWLPDDSWSLGKCGLKVLQYMAAGLPVVANPVGIHRRMVLDGQTGLLASTPAQWAEAIARLAADPALRRSMGQAGRRVVETYYSVERWGPQLAAILTSAARGERSAAVIETCGTPLPRYLGDRLTIPYVQSTCRPPQSHQ